MGVVSLVFRMLGAATSAYLMLCIVRIFMSWFPASSGGRAAELLGRVTEPYLAPWRRVTFLRFGSMDFSPIAALAVLSAASRVFAIASYGSLTPGLVLALVVEMIWSPVSFLLGFFIVLIVARILAYMAHWNSLHPIWRAVDAMINPALYRIQRVIYRNRIVNYMQGLATGVLVLLAARVLLGLAFGLMIRLLGTF